MQMRVAIVDDEKKWQEQIEKYIRRSQIIEPEEICCFDNGVDFVQTQKQFSLVFMDIEMPMLDGFTAIGNYKQKNNRTKFIITTTHTELSRKGYQVEAFRYIDKIHMEEEIKEALEAVAKIFKQERRMDINTEKYGMAKVKIKNIIYFETDKRKLVMHTVNDSVVCNESIMDMWEKLKEEGFYLSHRSYLVNMKFIKELENTKIILKNDEEIFLSRRKYSDLKNKFMEYKFNEANR